MESLKGKNVLIVGATGGIGQHVTRLMTCSGSNGFITWRNSNKAAIYLILNWLPDSELY